MLKDFAWNTFVSKGILESYIFYREIKKKGKKGLRSRGDLPKPKLPRVPASRKASGTWCSAHRK